MIKTLKTAALVIGMMICGLASAQNTIYIDGDAQVAKKSFKVYCEIISYNGSGLFSNKTTVEIDFGQQARFFSNDRRLVDESGRDIIFNSMLDAMNYMAERGWEFEQAYIVQSVSDGTSSTPFHHWILSKEVHEKSEITEGLMTRSMLRP